MWMMWLAILVPIAAAVFCYVVHSRKMAWWEYAVPLVVTLLVIALTSACTEGLQTRDIEYHGGWLVTAAHHLEWDEEVPCRHPIYRTESYECGDSKTSRTCTREVFVGYEHPYDVDDHPPYWEIFDSNGYQIEIEPEQYAELRAKFANETERIDEHPSYHSKPGGRYETRWPGDAVTLTPVVTEHAYVNRVQATSESVYKTRPVTEAEKRQYRPFAYPKIERNYEMTSVLPSTLLSGSVAIDKLNAILGRKKQVRVFVLLFTNQPEEAGRVQERFWQRGNKNELNVCVGLDNAKQVLWAYVFSWTKREDLKIDIRDWLIEHKALDLTALAAYLGPEIEAKWERRHFKEFNYLSVDPPGFAIALCWLLSALATGGVCWWAVENDTNA